MKSMNQKISQGVLWNLASIFITRGASTIFTLFLARILVPEAFGLIAMVTVVFELANTFVNSGLGTALIRSKKISDVDLNTVFYTNLILSGIAYTIIYVSASYISDFYNQPELTLLIKITGLVVFINAANIVQSSLLNRKMDFKSLMKANIVSVIVSGCLAVTAAWYDLGVWSLVIQMLSATAVSTFFLWIVSSWRPVLKFSSESFIRLFRFSGNLLVEGILDVLYRNSYVLVIGRFFGVEATGLYFFAKKISDLISQQLTSAIQQSTLPALSQIQDDNEHLRIKYRQIIQLTIFLIAPVMALLSGLALVLIPLAFKVSWVSATPYLQLLCIVGALYPLHAINVNLLIVKGKSGLLLRIGLIKRTVSVILLFLAIPYGVSGIIVGQIISSVFALIPNTYFSTQLIGYSLFDQLKDVVKPFINALIAGFAAWCFVYQSDSFLFIWLVGGGLFGIGVYFILSCLTHAEGMELLINKFDIKNKLKRLLK